MRRKYFTLIFVVLLIFCSCDNKQSEQERDKIKKETKTIIYSQIEQEGAGKEERGCSIYIMHQDFDVFTQEENEAIKTIDGVSSTEYYGGAARVKYYYQLGEDYNLVQAYTIQQYFEPTDREAAEHFIRSSGNITQEDLKEGNLPKEDNEVVLYTSDSAMLGKTVEMYFQCNDFFGQAFPAWDSYIEKEMVICGILKEKTEQIYFSNSFCEMIGKTMTEFILKDAEMTAFETGNYTEGFVRIKEQIGPEGSIELGDLGYEDLMEKWGGEYDLTIYSCGRVDLLVTYIDDSLDISEVLLSKYYLEHWNSYIREKYSDQSLYYSLYDIIEFSYCMPEHWAFSEEETNLGLFGYSDCSEVTMLHSDQKPMSQRLLLRIKDFSLKSGTATAAVSRKLFDAMHPYQGSKVIEVYIEEGKEDEVKEKLAEQGYIEYKVQTYERPDQDRNK